MKICVAVRLPESALRKSHAIPARSAMRCCSDPCPTRSTVAIKSLINVPVYMSRYLNLDSYHGTHQTRLPTSDFRPQPFLLRSDAGGPTPHFHPAPADLRPPLPESLRPGTAITANAGNSGRFSGAKLLDPTSDVGLQTLGLLSADSGFAEVRGPRSEVRS